MPEVMEQPTEERWKETATEFYDLWNFPNCLGVLDGKHVTIQAPPNSGSQFSNHKKTFSVLLALVDVHYNFIAVDDGSFGEKTAMEEFWRTLTWEKPLKVGLKHTKKCVTAWYYQ
jgi:hypothetical protein